MVNLVRLGATLLGLKNVSWAMHEAALADYNAKRYRRALEGFRILAERGHPEGMFRYGGMLANGMTAPPDPEEAARWYRRAADAGHGRAMAALGVLYFEGKGVPRDDIESYVWLKRSQRAKNGWEDASLTLRALFQRMRADDIATAELRAAGGTATESGPG